MTEEKKLITVSGVERQYYTKTTLIKYRGWTEKALRTFAPNPDTTCDNPHYRCGHPMCLYSRERVHKIEQTPEFIAFKSSHDARRDKARQAAQKAVDTKTRNLLNQITQTDIIVERLSIREIRQHILCGISDHDAPHLLLEGRDGNRRIVNFIRHELTNYDHALYNIANKTGQNAAYIEINRRIYASIAEAYPAMRKECDRQLRQKINPQKDYDCTGVNYE